jgi:hypothetical protein
MTLRVSDFSRVKERMRKAFSKVTEKMGGAFADYRKGKEEHQLMEAKGVSVSIRVCQII